MKNYFCKLLIILVLIPLVACQQSIYPKMESKSLDWAALYQANVEDLSSTEVVRISKKDVNRLAYEDVTLYRLNSRADDITALKMVVASTLTQEFPQWTANQILQKVNEYELNYKKQLEASQTGINPSRSSDAAIAAATAKALAVIIDPKAKAALVLKVLSSAGLIDGAANRYSNATDYEHMDSAQEWIGNETEQSRRVRESVVSNFARLQQQDARLRDVAKKTIDPVLGTSIDVDAKTQWKLNPDARTHQVSVETNEMLKDTRDFLESKIGSNGEIQISLKELNEYTRNRLEHVVDEIGDVKNSVVRIENQLGNYIEEQQERQNREEQAQMAAFKVQIQEQGERASVYLLTQALGFLDAKTAQRVNIIGNAILDIKKAITTYKDSMKAIQAMNNAGSAAMMSTLSMTASTFAAGFAIMGAFSSFGGGSDKAIMKMLIKLFEFVDTFRLEMHDRFDIVDKRLNTIYEEMLVQFHQMLVVMSDLSRDIQDVKIQLASIDYQLNKIGNQILTIDRKVTNLSQDIWSYIQNDTYNKCIKNYYRYQNPTLTSAELIGCLSDFANLSIHVAVNNSMTNSEVLPVTGGRVDYKTANEILDTKHVYENFGVLASIAYLPEYREQKFYVFTQPSYRLPNLQMWKFGVHGYLSVINLWPNLAAGPESNLNFAPDYQDLKNIGSRISVFLQYIREQDFLNKLHTEYIKTIEASNQIINTIWKEAVGKTLQEHTLLKEFTIGTPPADMTPQYAGIGTQVKDCDNVLSQVYPLTEEFLSSIPKEMISVAWLKAGAANMCYKLLTKITANNATYIDSSSNIGECIKEENIGSPRGNVERTVCTKYRRKFQQCEASFYLQPTWSFHTYEQELPTQTPREIKGENTSNYVATIKWEQKHGESCDLYEKNKKYKAEIVQKISTVLKDKNKEFSESINNHRFTNQMVNEQGANPLQRLVKDRWHQLRQLTVQEFKRQLYSSHEESLQMDTELAAQLENLEFRANVMRTFLNLGFLDAIAADDTMSASVNGKNAFVGKTMFVANYMNSPMESAIPELDIASTELLSQQMMNLLLKTSDDKSNDYVVLRAARQQIHSTGAAVYEALILKSKDLASKESSPVASTLESLDTMKLILSK